RTAKTAWVNSPEAPVTAASSAAATRSAIAAESANATLGQRCQHRRPSVREVAELAALGWVLVALADCGSQEAVSPLFGQPARASEDHWNVRVAYGKPTKHVCQPGAATGLTPEEIGVFTLDHDRRPADLSQTLHLKSQAAFGQRVGQVLERLTLD